MEVISLDPIKDGFCIVSDNELTLQTLNMNNIPAIELVDIKNCSFPIVGRMHRHHQGEDISIVNTLDQAREEGFDYFTKLYVIEKEYRVEIHALTVNKIEEAVADQVIYNEVPIRTKSFGWRWREVDESTLPEDWLGIAIRALYVTGLTHGFVKIGKLAEGQLMVIDIAPSNPLSVPAIPRTLPFTIGADVEFMVSCDGELIAASRFFPLEGPIGCDERQIEQDSGEYALAEIRPDKAESPHKLFDHIKHLIGEASKKAPYKNIEFRAGSMPFSGYQCGGHIHFGIPLSLPLLRALDHFLAIPIAMIEDSRTAKRRRRTKHGGLGRYRLKAYGFEYLSLSSWIVDPILAQGVFSLAYLVASHYDELQEEFLFNHLVQRAYYRGNQEYLKHYWPDIKNRLINTPSYSLYEKELSLLFEKIEEGNTVCESGDLRHNWGIEPGEHKFDQGMVIQIPKKTRKRFNLKEGQIIPIRAGKSLASAMVHAYPFSFRDSNRVQISPALQDALFLPKTWNPRIAARNGIIHLGPIIGILASKPFGRQTSYFHHLWNLGKEKRILVYVFGPEDINWEKQVINGSSVYGTDTFPFPNVIYDRYFLNNENSHIDINEVRTKLHAIYDIPFVNTPALFQLTGDKWKSHEILASKFKNYLPDTRLVTNSDDITTMLDRYGEIFVKPLGGGAGRGIIRIIRRPTGVFWMNSRQKTFQQIDSKSELITLIESLQEQRKFLVQEGVARKQIDGNQVEIRVYMQKNGFGQWLRTGMVGRLATAGIITYETEIDVRISNILSRLYPDPQERFGIRQKLANVARDVIEVVEEQVGSFGEIAVDLCIDIYNSIKIIEINAKPDNLFSTTKAYKLRNLAGRRLLHYATSLAGYESEEI
jgi:hypothetical protein